MIYAIMIIFSVISGCLVPYAEKKKKKSKDKKEAILEDNTPTIEELIKAQENKEQKLEENSTDEKTEELTYDKPLIIDDKEDIKK